MHSFNGDFLIWDARTCKDVEVASPATISRNGMVGESQLKPGSEVVLGETV